MGRNKPDYHKALPHTNKAGRTDITAQYPCFFHFLAQVLIFSTLPFSKLQEINLYTSLAAQHTDFSTYLSSD